MTKKKNDTQSLLKETARKMFLVEGKLHATTEDIAKAAGVPRTSVHYYFRSRDLLFKEVYNEAMEEFSQRISTSITSSKPFVEKLEDFIDVCLSQSLTYPYLETFLVTEIINQQEPIVVNPNDPPKWKAFMKEVKAEMKKGTLTEMHPTQFTLNLFSLLTYPSVSRPLVKDLLTLSDDGYTKMLKDRKKIILKVLMK